MLTNLLGFDGIAPSVRIAINVDKFVFHLSERVKYKVNIN